MIILILVLLFFPETTLEWKGKRHKFKLLMQGFVSMFFNKSDTIFSFEWDEIEEKI